MAASPTERTLRALRDADYLAAVVERWNPHTNTRHDLFKFADLLAVRPGTTLAVQATSGSNLSKRIAKLHAEPNVRSCLLAGWIVQAWGWTRYKQRVNGRWWRPRIVEIRLEDLE